MKARRIEKVLLYNEGAAERLHIGEIAEYLKGNLGRVPVEIKGDYPLFPEKKSLEYAKRLASIKVSNVSRRVTSGQEPGYGEVNYERRRLLGKTRAFGVLYDGFLLRRIFSEVIAREERTLEFIHMFFTNRLFATWEDGDGRYHARVSVYGIPSVISTTGLVEAPAKPREYYLLKQHYDTLGRDLLEVKERFKGRFIDYEDGRLTGVVKGYALQAVFYHLMGSPFCEDRGCRLYNAHWQEEVIFAQLESNYELCGQHRRVLDSLGRR